MEIPHGNTWKTAENRTLKWGSSPLPSREEIGCATVCGSFCDFLIDFGANYEHSGIRQSLGGTKRDFRRWGLDIADGATPAVFA
jgi:hypothetical protein